MLRHARLDRFSVSQNNPVLNLVQLPLRHPLSLPVGRHSTPKLQWSSAPEKLQIPTAGCVAVPEPRSKKFRRHELFAQGKGGHCNQFTVLSPSHRFSQRHPISAAKMPLILHNVPDDERYIGDDGVTRPYAMVFGQYELPFQRQISRPLQPLTCITETMAKRRVPDRAEQ